MDIKFFVVMWGLWWIGWKRLIDVDCINMVFYVFKKLILVFIVIFECY